MFDVLAYFPTAHAVHDKAPNTEEYVPGRHAMQAEEFDALDAFPFDPIGHNVAAVEFMGQYPPIGHAIFMDELVQ